MSILNSNKANCKNCYKCLRECPVKAISIINDNAKIVDNLCVLCGKCVNVCPQNAKYDENYLPEIKELISKGDVYVSLAPSFISNFPVKNIVTMRKALQKLGFKDVFETAEGASYVDKKYKEILNKNDYPNFITSSCPTVVHLIKKYYPNALKYLAKVDSPMVAHAKMIKQNHPNAYVVFVGPCISKKQEAFDSEIVDGVLTFTELNSWFLEEKIYVDMIDNETDEIDSTYNPGRFYPIERGVIKSGGNFNPDYDYISVTGIKKCMEVLENIDQLDGLFLEMSACDYSCVNGPSSIKNDGGCIKAIEVVRKYTNNTGDKPLDLSNYNVDLNKEFQADSCVLRMPSEYDIKVILNKLGKFDVHDELNCGACGYPTCREKAIAVYNGLARLDMCLPFMKERAESLSNQVMSASPFGIITFDKDLNVLECNKSAKDILGITSEKIKSQPVSNFYEMNFIASNLVVGDYVTSEKHHVDKTNKDVELSMVNLEKEHISFCIIRDITQDEENAKKLLKLKQNTIDLTNSVIEKQMRAAQEIASLLGETTAETKIAIYNLRKTLLKDE